MHDLHPVADAFVAFGRPASGDETRPQCRLVMRAGHIRHVSAAICARD